MYIAPTQSWDAVSHLHSIPFSLRSTVISFDELGTISHSEVFIECVDDDIEVATGVTADTHFIDAGMYHKGDLIKSHSLHVVNGEGSVRIINNGGSAISIPMGNAGPLDRPAKGVFVIEPGNEKYKLRCFASQTPLPEMPVKDNFWDRTVSGITTGGPLITLAHNQSVIPDIVEINFVMKIDIGSSIKSGDVFPIKLLGGSRNLNHTDSLWTTSADATSIYFAVPTSRILVKVDDSTFVNLMSPSFTTMTIRIRKKYPNPYNIQFQDFPLKGTQLNNKGAIDSPKIEYFSGSGEVLDSDLIFENRTPHAGTAFSNGEIIYYNQCGGTTTTDVDYAEQSSYIFHDHPIDSRHPHSHRVNNPKPITRAFSPEPEEVNYLRFKSAPSEKMGGMVIWDRVKSKMINIGDDTAGDWVATHRWQYESSAPTYDADTGWLPLEQYGMQMPKFNIKMSELFGGDAPPSKVDIFIRTPIDGFDGMPLGATWSMANMKGGAKAYGRSMSTQVWNTWDVVYNKNVLKMLNGTPPTIPNWFGTGIKDSSGNSFDSAIGVMQYRICVRK